MKRVTCKSGLKGWQAKVREVYSSLDELKEYTATCGIACRLGYDGSYALWMDNPTIRGSVDPDDLEIVTSN